MLQIKKSIYQYHSIMFLFLYAGNIWGSNQDNLQSKLIEQLAQNLADSRKENNELIYAKITLEKEVNIRRAEALEFMQQEKLLRKEFEQDLKKLEQQLEDLRKERFLKNSQKNQIIRNNPNSIESLENALKSEKLKIDKLNEQIKEQSDRASFKDEELKRVRKSLQDQLFKTSELDETIETLKRLNRIYICIIIAQILTYLYFSWYKTIKKSISFQTKP